MRRKRHAREIGRWLEAERSGQDRLAEEALAALFTNLPRPMPSAGFAGRVMGAAGMPASRLQVRWWIAAALSSLGLALPFLLVGQLLLPDMVQLSAVLAGSLQRLFGLADGFGGALPAMRLIVHLRSAVWVVATSPPALFAILAASLSAALAVRGLDGLLTAKRSTSHV